MLYDELTIEELTKLPKIIGSLRHGCMTKDQADYIINFTDYNIIYTPQYNNDCRELERIYRSGLKTWLWPSNLSDFGINSVTIMQNDKKKEFQQILKKYINETVPKSNL